MKESGRQLVYLPREWIGIAAEDCILKASARESERIE